MKKEQFSTLDMVLIAFIGYFIGLMLGFWLLSDEANAVSSYTKPALSEAVGAERLAGEPRYKIAVLDTGFDPARASANVKLCKTGHWDALSKTSIINHVHPHGTQVISVIAEKLKDVDYCIIVFNVFYAGLNTPIDYNDVTKALNDTVGLHVDAINISFSGALRSSVERVGFANVNKLSIPVFVAAGNNGQNIDKNCRAYPACYEFKNIIVVGAQNKANPRIPAETSNYGQRVQIWAPGTYVDNTGAYFGTSYAAPRALAEYILFLEHKRLHPIKAKTRCLNKLGGHAGYCE